MAKQKFARVEMNMNKLSASAVEDKHQGVECEPSIVPETSPSVSMTIGTKDTNQPGQVDELVSKERPK